MKKLLLAAACMAMSTAATAASGRFGWTYPGEAASSLCVYNPGDAPGWHYGTRWIFPCFTL